MEFATGALGTLLPKLGQLLQDEYNLQKGVKKDIEFVRRELQSMQAALRDVGEVPQEQLKEGVKIWARDVRELSYDMEDIVDTFLVRVQGSGPPSKRSVKRFIKKMTNIVTKATTRHEIGQEIKDIKERLKEVAERRDRYKVDAIPPAKTSSVDPRITALYTNASNLVGIDEAREDLIRRLMKEDGMSTEQRIVSIVGFGGLGKTTLAKVVYDKLKPEFNCTAFVSVSRDPDITNVLKDMVYELDKTENKDIHSRALQLGETQLIGLINEFLKNKRYLIVIDDIWDTKPWETILCALPENGLKSRIITTTRKNVVAEQVGGCYKIKPLPHNSAQILFYRRIFGSEKNCPTNFFDVSENILKKCGGIPLAIITISSLLANKSINIHEWHDVSCSIGSGLGSNPAMDNMRKILLLSYYDLTPQLKTCLLYLSIFPEDCKIDKDRLIWRWIAEGFIQQDVRQSLHEIGNSYFNELLNRSLIQPASMEEDDMSPITCRVHDMVLDLIWSLSREESFATTVSGDCKQSTSSETKVRRLSVHNASCPKMNMSKLRSLTISNSDIINSAKSLPCYYLLRVLDLEDCNLSEHRSIEFVSKLFHLRYLSLERTEYAGEVPRDIGKLQYLQTLNFSKTGIKELPSSVLELRQLMSLCVGKSTRLPNGLRNLSSLEFLDLNVDCAHIAEELGHLTQLRVLGVTLKEDKQGGWDESMCKVLVESLAKLHKTQILGVFSDGVEFDLEGSVDSSMQNLAFLLIDGTRRLPKWIDPASFLLLSHLYIKVGEIRSEDFHVLGRLHVLRCLKVEVPRAKQVFERFMIREDAFPCVTKCELKGFSMVPSMFPPGAMPRLQRFRFDIRLEDFIDSGFIIGDLALSHLPSLKAVLVCLDGERNRVVNEEVTTKVKEALRNAARANPEINICSI